MSRRPGFEPGEETSQGRGSHRVSPKRGQASAWEGPFADDDGDGCRNQNWPADQDLGFH